MIRDHQLKSPRTEMGSIRFCLGTLEELQQGSESFLLVFFPTHLVIKFFLPIPAFDNLKLRLLIHKLMLWYVCNVTSFQISLHGGQVLSWRTDRGEELLFTSTKVNSKIFLFAICHRLISHCLLETGGSWHVIETDFQISSLMLMGSVKSRQSSSPHMQCEVEYQYVFHRYLMLICSSFVIV